MHQRRQRASSFLGSAESYHVYAALSPAKELTVVIPVARWGAILVHVYSARLRDLEQALQEQASVWLRQVRPATLATVALD